MAVSVFNAVIASPGVVMVEMFQPLTDHFLIVGVVFFSGKLNRVFNQIKVVDAQQAAEPAIVPDVLLQRCVVQVHGCYWRINQLVDVNLVFRFHEMPFLLSVLFTCIAWQIGIGNWKFSGNDYLAFYKNVTTFAPGHLKQPLLPVTSDFEIWKTDPQKYFVRHQAFLLAIVHKSWFSGHLDNKHIHLVEVDLLNLMLSEEVTNRLMVYQGITDFLAFYSKILKDAVVRYSQNEDLLLLKSDYQTLILKYKPLIDKLVDDNVKFKPILSSFRDDICQQIFENLLNKKETIVNHFKPEMNFRNYLWKIIKNDCFSQWEHEFRYNRHFSDQEGKIQEVSNEAVALDNVIVEDVFRIFTLMLKAYTDSKYKLVVCLKAVMFLPVNPQDLQRLFRNCETGCSAVEFDAIAEKFMQGDENLRGIFTRMQHIRPIINLAENSDTDERSYWRWTNLQMLHLANYFNKTYGMNFDRETLKILVEKYFEVFYDK